MNSWRAVLRFARRDARIHLRRTVLATLLIGLPVWGLIVVPWMLTKPPANPHATLATLGTGVQGEITATALPRKNVPPFAQLPTGAPGPWMDEPDIAPADAQTLAAHLSPRLRLSEWWKSPPVAAIPNATLAPGQQRSLTGTQADTIAPEISHGAFVQLTEYENESYRAYQPKLRAGHQARNATEIVLSNAAAHRLGVRVGDTLTLIAPPDSGVRESFEGNLAAVMKDSARGYRVSGIADVAGYRAWSRAGWLQSLAAAQPQGIQRHWSAFGDAPITWSQAKQLNTEQAFVVSRHVLTHAPAAAELYPVELDPLTVVAALTSTMVALVLGGILVLFLVTPALALSAEQSRRTLGLVAATGGAPHHLTRVILAQGLVIGVTGGIIGAVLGAATLWGAAIAATLLTASPDTLDPRLQPAWLAAAFPWGSTVTGIVVAVLLGLLAAFLPARQVARLNPCEALRDRVDTARETRLRTRSLRLGLVIFAATAALALLLFLLPRPPVQTPAAALTPGEVPAELLPWLAGPVLVIGGFLAALILLIRGSVPTMAHLASGRALLLRFTLRDLADHPSRSVPTVLAILLTLLAASYHATLTASSQQSASDAQESLEWHGTVFVAPEIPIANAFDRAITKSTVRDLARAHPHITEGLPVYGVRPKAAKTVTPLLPEGHECGSDEAVHARSAHRVGAPVQCVPYTLGAAYNEALRFGSVYGGWGSPLVMAPETLRATRIPDAQRAARTLAAGGVVVTNAAYVDDEGKVRLRIGADPIHAPKAPAQTVRLPGVYAPGVGATLTLSPATAERLGITDTAFAGMLLKTAQPLSRAERDAITATDTAGLISFNVSDSDLGFEQGGLGGDPTSLLAVLAPVALFGVIALAAAVLSTLLAHIQLRRDADTALAVGAGPGFLTRVSLLRTAIIVGTAVPCGILAGVGLGAYHVAWNGHLGVTGPWLSTVVPWLPLTVAGMAVCVGALCAALLISRPPKQLVLSSRD